VNFKKNSELIIPEEFQKKLDEVSTYLKTAFDALTPGRQRAYIFYFSAPKQSKPGSHGLKNICSKFSTERN